VLEDLWESLPEPNRRELVSLLAPGPLEVRHESDPR
jgi:hypothetical protein